MLLCLASELIFQTVSRLASSRRFPPQKFAHSYFRVCIFTLHYFRIPDFRAPSFLEPMSCPLTGRDLTHKNTINLASVTCRVFGVCVFFITVPSLPIATPKCFRVGCAKTRKRLRLPSSDLTKQRTRTLLGVKYALLN